MDTAFLSPPLVSSHSILTSFPSLTQISLVCGHFDSSLAHTPHVDHPLFLLLISLAAPIFMALIAVLLVLLPR